MTRIRRLGHRRTSSIVAADGATRAAARRRRASTGATTVVAARRAAPALESLRALRRHRRELDVTVAGGATSLLGSPARSPRSRSANGRRSREGEQVRARGEVRDEARATRTGASSPAPAVLPWARSDAPCAAARTSCDPIDEGGLACVQSASEPSSRVRLAAVEPVEPSASSRGAWPTRAVRSPRSPSGSAALVGPATKPSTDIGRLLTKGRHRAEGLRSAADNRSRWYTECPGEL